MTLPGARLGQRGFLAVIRPALALLLLAAPALADAPMRAVTGALTYRERIALPETAELSVEVIGADGRILAAERAASEGRQVPLPFRVWVPAGTAARLAGSVATGGATLFAAEPVAIPSGTGPVELGEIVMARVPQAEAGAAPIALRCGGLDVGLAGLPDGVRLTLADGRTLELVAVPAASGARFEDPGDPATFFWSRGDGALLGLDGTRLPECTLAASAEPPLRATGNEPGWRVEIDDARIEILLDYGARRIEAPAPEPEADGTARLWRLPAEGVTVRAEPRLCVDTMSGVTFPLAVTLETAAGRLDGCGGPPGPPPSPAP